MKLPNLRQSKNGVYSYRRVVPKRYRDALGAREVKKSFKTKDHTVARKLWELEEREFERRIKQAERQIVGALTDTDNLDVAREQLKRAGVLPEQAPKLSPNATNKDIEAYLIEFKRWQEKKGAVENIVLDNVLDESFDYEQMAQDYANGSWGQPGYATPYKKPPTNSVASVSHRVLRGETVASLEATWQMAMDLYFQDQAATSNRTPHDQEKFEKKSRAMFERFAKFIDKRGCNTPLSEVTRDSAKRWLRTLSSTSTANRYNNQLSAVINHWNTEKPEEAVNNPFKGLSSKKQEKGSSKKRRSFKPDEWNAYRDALLSHKNRELSLIGLIMLYTGCRNGEAVGLKVQDIKLDAKPVPHIIFRANENRKIDKGGLERAVPIVPELVEALESYSMANDKEADVFTKYGKPKHYTNVSQQLVGIIRNKLGISDPKLVAYSTRSTFMQRGHIAGIPEAHLNYLVGHSSQGANTIHREHYLKTDPPEMHLEGMIRAFEIETWGYFEE